MNAVANVERSHFPFKKALKYRVKHKLSYGEIANKLGCSKTHVFDQLKPILTLLDNPDLAQSYRDNRGDLLNNLELQLAIDLTDEDKRKSASLNNTAYAFNIISQQRRLEEGQPTEQIAFADVSHAVNKAREERQAIAEELAALRGSAVVDEDDGDDG